MKKLRAWTRRLFRKTCTGQMITNVKIGARREV